VDLDDALRAWRTNDEINRRRLALCLTRTSDQAPATTAARRR
jgi:hypothetical protein